jgi:hypothetical protein
MIGLYAGTSTYIPATVLSPKINPTGPEGILDETYSAGSYADI